jgi:small subunit ribosomal protein S13
MARIAGINIPMNKHVVIGLTHIFGVGNSRAVRICDAAGVKHSVKVKDLTDAEVASLRSQVAKFAVEGDLHQALDGSRLLPRHPASQGLADARSTHPHQCAHPQGPA